MKNVSIFSAVIFTGLLLVCQATVASVTSPTSFVEEVFEDLVDQINAFGQQPSSSDIEQLFAQTLDPHIDYQGLARWTLREHWSGSNDTQQLAFLTALKKHVIKTYASALTFDKNTRLDLDKDVKAGQRITQVSGTIKTAQSNDTNVQFRLVGGDGAWQIFDVGVHGISVAKTLRADIAAIVSNGGIDAATSALSTGNFRLVSQR